MIRDRKKPTLNQIYNEVSRRSDTNGTKINVAETRRVLSEFFIVLSRLTLDDALHIVRQGLSRARDK